MQSFFVAGDPHGGQAGAPTAQEILAAAVDFRQPRKARYPASIAHVIPLFAESRSD
jgi:hypothetical protein